jgi:hypothetical protein
MMQKLSGLIGQASPRASFEQRAEVYDCGDRLELVVPSSWQSKGKNGTRQLAFEDDRGERRTVALPSAIAGPIDSQQFGHLTRMAFWKGAEVAPARTATHAPHQRHLGHRGALGAA